MTRAFMGEVIDAANKCGHALESPAALEQIKRAETMSEYKPSTLLDWEAGKPVEIQAIWGEPLRRAAAAGGHSRDSKWFMRCSNCSTRVGVNKINNFHEEQIKIRAVPGSQRAQPSANYPG